MEAFNVRTRGQVRDAPRVSLVKDDWELCITSITGRDKEIPGEDLRRKLLIRGKYKAINSQKLKIARA